MASWILVVLSCLAAALLLVFRRKKALTIPAPKGVPIFGNLFQFNRDKPFLLLTKWAKELGPIFCVKMLNTNIIAVSDYEGIHTALLGKARDFGGRSIAYSQRALYLWDYGRSIFPSNPTAHWKFLRSTLHAKVKIYDSGLRQVENINMEVINDLVQEIKDRGQKPFDPKDSVYKAIANIICVFLLGKKYTYEDEIFKLVKYVERKIATAIGPGSKGSELDAMWWLRHFGNKSFKNLEALKNTRMSLWNLVKADIEERRQKHDATGDDKPFSGGIVGDLLDDIKGMNTVQSKQPQTITEHTAMIVFHELVFAGTSTTSNSFYAFLNIISQQRGVQERLREEVDRVVGAGRQASIADRPSMPYTRAVILELLRFTSIVPQGVPHQALVDSSLKGHAMPKGSVVLCNLWAMHHDEEFWGDPWVFRPERFLDDNGDVLPADDKKRKHLMPFGAGLRVCLGESLAMMRLFLLVSTMVQQFIMTPGAAEVSYDPRGYETGAVLAQPHFEMQFIPRRDK